MAIKDLEDTAGMRTTYGSPIYRDHVPTEDTLMVARLRRAGAIVIGKTNTPEFGAGSQTFNPVFGATRNPYDPRAHAGRQQRRRGRRGRQRHGPVRRRVGSRREHPQPRVVLQPRRAAHRRRGACRRCRRPTRGTRWASWGRWRAASRTRPCCCAPWPAPTRARRCRSTIRRRPSCSAPTSIRAGRASPGAATSATCPSSPR